MVKHFSKRDFISIFLLFLIIAVDIQGQDVHYAQVQDMGLWYNPALKTNKVTQVHINIRSVNYPNIIAYTSKAIAIDLVLIRTDRKDEDNSGFANLTLGINTDNSGDGVLTASSGMVDFSYSLPLSYDNTFLSLGFQGVYNFNKIALDNYRLFPAQFDKHGAIGSAILADPYQSGNHYEYFAAGAGFAVFHIGEKTQWYAGGSVRRFNKPASIKGYAPDFRLPMNDGIQAGYATSISSKDAIAGYGNFTWQTGAHEHVIGGLYTRDLDDSSTISFSLGLGWRIGDAILPNAGFRFRNHRFTFCYEFNASDVVFKNYYRKAFEFSYVLSL